MNISNIPGKRPWALKHNIIIIHRDFGRLNIFIHRDFGLHAWVLT